MIQGRTVFPSLHIPTLSTLIAHHSNRNHHKICAYSFSSIQACCTLAFSHFTHFAPLPTFSLISSPLLIHTDFCFNSTPPYLSFLHPVSSFTYRPPLVLLLFIRAHFCVSRFALAYLCPVPLAPDSSFSSSFCSLSPRLAPDALCPTSCPAKRGASIILYRMKTAERLTLPRAQESLGRLFYSWLGIARIYQHLSP